MKKLIFAGMMMAMTTSGLLAQTASDESAQSCETFFFDEMTYSPGQTVFKLFAPDDAKKVVVRLYKEGVGGRPRRR